jgi:hypothetical protein
MTHVPGGSMLEYDSLYMTPNQIADFSNGPVTIRFDVSTLQRSDRDWIDVWVQAWDTQEQRILDDDVPSALGNPRNAAHIEMGRGPNWGTEGQFHFESFDSNRSRVNSVPATGPSWNTVLTPSAQARSTVEIVLSRTHVKIWMPQHNLVWVDKDISPLNFTQGVVSYGHHVYGPEKGRDLSTGGQGQPNTWHWDNLSISPSIPFTIVKTDHRAASYQQSAAARTFTLAQPAPANSLVRFTAMGRSVKVSFDGGPAVATTRTGPNDASGGGSNSYIAQVPQGTTRMTFTIDPAFDSYGEVQNPTIFARTSGVPSPTPSPTPATATATASSTAAATSTPKVTATATPTAASTPKVTATATVVATATPSVPSPTPTVIVAPPPGGASGSVECQAQFRYREGGRGVYREVWRAVDCDSGQLLAPVR